MPAARWAPCLLAATFLPLTGLQAQWQGALGLQERLYLSADPQPPAAWHEPTLAGNASRDWRWHGGAERLVAAFSLRAGIPGDQDPLPDVRQLELDVARSRWTLRAGVSQVFWGVLESNHLVDVVNQRAPDPGAQGDVKLGQPMVNFAAGGSWGTVDLYLLPWFRARPLTGRAARLWSPQIVAENDAQLRSPSGLRLLDWAVRVTRTAGPWDVGLALFMGTDREPAFQVGGGGPAAALVPHYQRIQRLSLDVQWTEGAWLGKLEAFTADPAAGRYLALGTGIEYAPRDYLSVYGELLLDSRGAAATTSWEHDLCAGARLLYRDGTAELRGSVDPVSGNVILGLQTVRRLSNSLALTLETRAFVGDATREPPLARRSDASVALGVTRYF